MTSLLGKEQQIARITMAAKVEYLPAVLSFISEFSIKMGLEPMDSQRLQLVVEEACMNVIEHAFDSDEMGTFDVIVSRKPGQVTVAIEDQGLPFDIKRFSTGQGSGLGIMLMKAFADEIAFLNLGRKGKRVELVKKLTYKDISSYVSLEDEKEKAESPIPVVDDAQIQIRQMKPEDTVNLAKCMYRCYGYTYVNDKVYFPDEVAELIASGLLTSYVAVTPEGDIIGHVAFTKENADSRVGETGQWIVDPHYRGYGLLNKMNVRMSEFLKAGGIYGTYAEAVTVHPFSQKAILSYGGHEIGVLLGFTPATMFFKNIQQDEQPKRRAAVLYHTRVNEEPLRSVYPPFHHHSMIERIYKENGLKRNISKASDITEQYKTASASQVDVRVRIDASRAFMRVTQYGADLVELVKFRLHELCLQRIDCIYIDLPLCEPPTSQFCASLEMLGFFFGCVIPELINGDVLRLQYLNNVDMDLENTQIASDFGKELFDYVLKAKESW